MAARLTKSTMNYYANVYWIYAAHSEVHRTWKTGRYAIRNINTRWGRPEGSQGGLVQTGINTPLVVGLHFAACAGSQAS